MKSEHPATLLIIDATPEFPTYFVHPIYSALQNQGLTLEYIDTDSHSDDFYVDFILQSLSDKKQIFVYIEIQPDQKKLPNNCLKILSYLNKVKERVYILLSCKNVLLQAYTRSINSCAAYSIPEQVEYILNVMSFSC
ncbi:MAG: hypothetical protein NZ455_01515 [Bacteroidia bacterium]|nr:hypothetical protein [Bacteroidia bacterium]MDW8346822.1 hypothetical protein [Bacteroidia bacterium]